jgi:hypothetical protein
MAAALAQRSRARKGVNGPMADAWYEVKLRASAARKTIEDALKAWRDDLTDRAKEQIRKAVKATKDAIDGALTAARAAGSTAVSTWVDLRDAADKAIGTIGGAIAGGAVGGLFVMLALAVIMLKVAGRE